MALVGGALLFGCRRGRQSPAVHPRLMAAYQQRLTLIAARDSGCSPVQVQPIQLGPQAWTVNTCTGPREYFLQCPERHRRWVRCRWRRVQTVSEAASTVLGCPPYAVAQQVSANPALRTAVGCGRSTQLALSCNPVGCGWLPAGPAQPVASAPPASPPAPPAAYGGGATIVYVPQQ